MQWNMQAVNITNNIKVKIDFTLPELSATKIVTWTFMWITLLRAYII